MDRRLWTFDAWTGRMSHVVVQKAYAEGECACCKEGQYEYLQGKFAGRTVSLCGRNAVQVYPGRAMTIDLAELADRLRPIARAEPRCNPLLLKVQIDDYELTVFIDGRALVKGTSKPEEARAVYARYHRGLTLRRTLDPTERSRRGCLCARPAPVKCPIVMLESGLPTIVDICFRIESWVVPYLMTCFAGYRA